MNIIALIPARANSKRIPGKNIKDFFGHPLMAYTIQLALNSGLFDDGIIVSTDSIEYLDMARSYGAEGFIRSDEASKCDSPDIEWIRPMADIFSYTDIFVILRPTNPFRTKKMLQMALGKFKNVKGDSLRAIEPVKQHPQKMWSKVRNRLHQYYNPFGGFRVNSFTMPTQSLDEVYVQNGSLEIIWRKTIRKYGNVCGEDIIPFVTNGYEGFDINTPEDWILAEELVKRKLVKLPEVK